MLRVGYPVNTSDDLFTLTAVNGKRGGTFHNFMMEVFKNRGYGLVEKSVSRRSKDIYPSDPYTACMLGKPLLCHI